MLGVSAGIGAALKIAGIAISSEFIGRIMEDMGHGNKVVFVRIATYVACGYIAFEAWWDAIRYVAHTFGVRI